MRWPPGLRFRAALNAVSTIEEPDESTKILMRVDVAEHAFFVTIYLRVAAHAYTWSIFVELCASQNKGFACSHPSCA